MDLLHKIAIAEQAIRSIAEHDDAPALEVLRTLDSVASICKAYVRDVKARRPKKAAESKK